MTIQKIDNQTRASAVTLNTTDNRDSMSVRRQHGGKKSPFYSKMLYNLDSDDLRALARVVVRTDVVS